MVPMISLGSLRILAALVYLSAVSVSQNEWYVGGWQNQEFETGHGPEIVNEARITEGSARVSAVVQKGLKDWIGSASGIDNRELEAYLRNKLRARVEEWGIEILTIRVSGYGEAEILHKRFPQGELPIAVRLLEGTKGKLGVVRRGDSAETLDSV